MSFDQLYQRMVQGLAALDNDEIKQTIHDEACVNVKTKAGVKKGKIFLLEKNPQKDEIAEIQQFLAAWVSDKNNKKSIKSALDQGSTVTIKKGMILRANGKILTLPRSIRFTKLENGEIGIIINTKSKIAISETTEPGILSPVKAGKIDRREFPKPAGSSKHGTAAVLLWPRDLKKNALDQYPKNPLLWNSVEPYTTEENKKTAIQEAEISQQNHPFIQPVLIDKVVPVGGKINTYGLASQMGTLDDNLKSLDETQRNTVVTSFLLAMQHLHQQTPPILHRDFKPAQILLFEENGKMISKVTDFGFTTKPENKAIGTPLYFSPAIAAEDYIFRDHTGVPCVKFYGAQSRTTPYKASKEDDIWAIGCTLYGVFFPDDPDLKNIATVLQPQQNKPKPPVGAPVLDVMKYIMENCLKKDPAKRFTMDQIIQHLPDQQVVAELKQMIEDKRRPVESIPPSRPPPAIPTRVARSPIGDTTRALNAQVAVLNRYRPLEAEFIHKPTPEKLRKMATFPDIDEYRHRDLNKTISRCISNPDYWSYETMTAALHLQHGSDSQAIKAVLQQTFEDQIKNQYIKNPSVGMLSYLVSYLKNGFKVSANEQDQIFKKGMEFFKTKVSRKDPEMMNENYQDLLFLAEVFNKKADPIHKIAKGLKHDSSELPAADGHPLPKKPKSVAHAFGDSGSLKRKAHVAPAHDKKGPKKTIR